MGVKDRLGIPSHEPLMPFLGGQGKALLMQETEDEWELVLSQDHLAGLAHSDRIVASFNCASGMPVTKSWRAAVDGRQRRYDDVSSCLEVLTELGESKNEEPPWLLETQEQLSASGVKPGPGKVMEHAVAMALEESTANREEQV